MPASITPEERTAGRLVDDADADQPVTFVNSFVVPEGRDQAFLALWTETSRYFRAQPGFLSLRLHRAVSHGVEHRFVNMARWASEAHFRAPHATDEFRRLVSQDAWSEFPSSPALYQVIVAVDAPSAATPDATSDSAIDASVGAAVDAEPVSAVAPA